MRVGWTVQIQLESPDRWYDLVKVDSIDALAAVLRCLLVLSIPPHKVVKIQAIELFDS